MLRNDHDRERILVALCGLSPAVLTETVWYLATTPGEQPVHRLVVLTTFEGRGRIRDELIDEGVWGRMLKALPSAAPKPRLTDNAACIQVFTDSVSGTEVNDIGTDEISAACADTILETLRQFTENPDVEVVFSIAGGRKTMSALGALCMTLLGRHCDRLCHVLIDPPFDNPALEPRFYFPDPAVERHVVPDGTAVSPSCARIVFCDVPFVRIRNLFVDEHHRLPGTFTRLVTSANQAVSEAAPLRLTLDPRTCTCTVRDHAFALTPAPFAMFWFLADRCVRGLPELYGMQLLSEAFAEFCAAIEVDHMPECLHHNSFKTWHDRENCAKLVSLMKSGITSSCENAISSSETDLILPARKRGVYGLKLAGEKITIL